MSADNGAAPPHDAPTPAGPAWWLGLAGGGAIFAFGVFGLLANGGQTRPGNWLTWVGGGLVVHDALLAPVVFIAGLLLTRLLPRAVRAGVQATLAVCAAVALMSVPVLNAAGRRADNPSLLPHDYGENLAIVLAIILSAGLALTLARAAWRRRA